MPARAHLDHASTSALRPEAAAAMHEAVGLLAAGALGDPSRIHQEGMAARGALEEARERVAALFGARGREVVFTSGATESIATACFGAVRRDGAPGTHQVVPVVEHSAVRAAADRHEATVVGVDGTGRVDAGEVLAAIRPDTALVHIQWANHEVGTVQPVADVVAGCRERGVLVHVDAAQAAGRFPIDFRSLGADLLSISGHKFGGPMGSGALLVRRGLRLAPLLVGGDQERARRAGLENLPALLGLGAAAEAIATAGVQTEATRQTVLADRVREWAAGAEGIEVLGHPTERAPHLVCLGFADVEPQPVLLGLDAAGVAVHSGSSCSSEALEPSPVLEAMGVDAQRSLRVSVGWNTSEADVNLLLEALPAVLDRLRALRGA